MAALQAKFEQFCAFGAGKDAVAEMDNAKFAKFCRDSQLLDKKFTATDAGLTLAKGAAVGDLIFSKVKAKGERKIPFPVFRDKALPLVAEKKGCSPEAVVRIICGSEGPASSGTKAAAVKLHDDKSQYTGVYSRGGPTNVDKEKLTLKDIVSDHNALTCDVRGVVHK